MPSWLAKTLTSKHLMRDRYLGHPKTANSRRTISISPVEHHHARVVEAIPPCAQQPRREIGTHGTDRGTSDVYVLSASGKVTMSDPPVDFQEFAVSRWARLTRTAVLLGASPNDAEDIVQEMLLKCLRSWRRVTSSSNFEAYTTRVLINCIRDRQRTLQRNIRILAASSQNKSTVLGSGEELATRIDRALDRLPHDQRKVLVLRYYLGFSERDIAEVLGIPPGTVMSRSSRAVESLAKDMQLQELLRVARNEG